LEEPGLDAICRGGGEEALVELADRLAAGGDLSSIPNIWWKEPQGRIHEDAPRPIATDLHAVGAPDRALVYEATELYRNSPRKVFKADRGCPMHCSFCFHHAMKRKVYGVTNDQYVRRRSVGEVIAEVQAVRARWPLEYVHFVDDIFNI